MYAQDTLTSFTDITDTPIIGLQCYYQDIITLKNGSLGCGLPNIDYYSGLPFLFNLYCVNCSVTLDTEWTYHIGVDLDLQAESRGRRKHCLCKRSPILRVVHVISAAY